MRTLFAPLVLAIALSNAHTAAQSASPVVGQRRTTLLVHVTQGPENPTRAALAFLVAKTAIEEATS